MPLCSPSHQTTVPPCCLSFSRSDLPAASHLHTTACACLCTIPICRVLCHPTPALHPPTFGFINSIAQPGPPPLFCLARHCCLTPALASLLTGSTDYTKQSQAPNAWRRVSRAAVYIKANRNQGKIGQSGQTSTRCWGANGGERTNGHYFSTNRGLLAGGHVARGGGKKLCVVCLFCGFCVSGFRFACLPACLESCESRVGVGWGASCPKPTIMESCGAHGLPAQLGGWQRGAAWDGAEMGGTVGDEMEEGLKRLPAPVTSARRRGAALLPAGYPAQCGRACSRRTAVPSAAHAHAMRRRRDCGAGAGAGVGAAAAGRSAGAPDCDASSL